LWQKLLRRSPLHPGAATRFGGPGFFFPGSICSSRNSGCSVDITRNNGGRASFHSVSVGNDGRRRAFRAELRLAHLILFF